MTALALAAAVAFVWVRVVKTLTAPSNAPKAVGQPGALVWDDRVFTTPAQLKAYLGPKTYARWSVRHPTAFGAPAPAKPKPSKATAAAKKTTKPKHTTHVAASPTHVAASPRISSSKWRQLLTGALMVLVMLGGLALFASAVVPIRMAPLTLQRLYIEDPDRRMIAFAAGTAILLGFGVSLYLS